MELKLVVVSILMIGCFGKIEKVQIGPVKT